MKITLGNTRREYLEGGFTIPIMLGIVAVASAASAGISAAGAIAQGDAAKDAADYNAKVSENAAKVARQQAQFDAEQIRDKQRRLLGAQRAAWGASGVDASSGSPLEVARDSSLQNEMEALTAIYTGRVQANQSTAQAKLDRMQGRSAQAAGYYGAAGSLLTGVSSMANAGYEFAQYKSPSPKKG